VVPGAASGIIGWNVTEDPDQEQLASARRTLALLHAQAEAVRADLASLRRETAQAKQELSGLRTAQLLEVNDRLVQAAVQADTAAQTAVSSLDELTRSTQHDELTGATTRVLMLDRLQSAIARAQRSAARVGLLFLDLDGFKQINDTSATPSATRCCAWRRERLASVVRESDSVSRYGGDEFVVLLAEITSAADAAPIARKILDALGRAGDDRPAPISLGRASASPSTRRRRRCGDADPPRRCGDVPQQAARRGGFEFYQDDGNTDPGDPRLRGDAAGDPPRRHRVLRARGAAARAARGQPRARRCGADRAEAAGRGRGGAPPADQLRRDGGARAAQSALGDPDGDLAALRRARQRRRKERQLQLVQRQAALIARLIDDLLDGSRVGTGEFRLQRRDLQLDAILGVAADACRHAIDAKQQRLVLDVRPSRRS
jgi:diguanylate cyclase (GGDEF)-like protein